LLEKRAADKFRRFCFVSNLIRDTTWKTARIFHEEMGVLGALRAPKTPISS
jgi:hypothetical protein